MRKWPGRAFRRFAFLVNKFSIRDRHARQRLGRLAGEATTIVIAACLKARESCG
jgi:hypothetical protein